MLKGLKILGNELVVYCIVVGFQLNQWDPLSACFSEANSEWLLGVACLNPSNPFSSFLKKKFIRVVELHSIEFSSIELMVLSNQLKYIYF